MNSAPASPGCGVEARHQNWGNDVSDQIGIPGVNVKDDVLSSGLTASPPGLRESATAADVPR